MFFAEPKSGSTDDHSKEPSVEVATPEEAFNVVSGDNEELMEIETAWALDNYHVASADPQTISNEPQCTATTEIPATVNAEPLPQHQTSPRKPNVLSSIDTSWTLDADIDDYLVPPPMSKTDVNFTTTTVSPSIRTTWTLDVDDHLVLQAEFNLPVAYTPFSLPIGNTDGDIMATRHPCAQSQD